MELQEGTLFDGRFRLVEWKGAGAYGEVWLALDTQTDVEVAIKIYVSMDSQGLQDFKKEFQVSFDLNHTNLLHANFLEICKEDQRPYLVMPFCPNGSVMKLMGKISETEMWKYIRDVASGLAYLHSQNPPIIHQDIKPDNILVTKNGEYVITDFGISQQARSTLRKSVKHGNSAGSVAYMGPERFGKDYHAIKASDIWSLGITIYELTMGDLPFCGMGGGMQRQGAEIPDLSADFSDDLNRVMQSCLAKETWDRPTADMLADYAAQKVMGRDVQIPWLTETDKDDNGVEPQQSAELNKSFGEDTVFFGNNGKHVNQKEKPAQNIIKSDDNLNSTGETECLNGNDVGERRHVVWYVWLITSIVGLLAGAVLNLLNII